MAPAAKASPMDSLQTSIAYDLTAETAVGTGGFTAFQLVANRHHVLSARPNTAYARAALRVDHPLSRSLVLTAVIDGVASVHAEHSAYVQQCFVSLSGSKFNVTAGSQEKQPVLRHASLSSGSFVKGTNAKPIPQVSIGSNGFVDIPLTGGWLQVNLEGGYGHFVDDGYRKSVAERPGQATQPYAQNIYYHQKHLYFRSSPEKRFFAIVGIEHTVQFSGRSYTFTDGHMAIKEKPANVKAFWNVILPLGDSNYFSNDAMEDWVYGNHVGMMTYQVGWNIDSRHQLQAYLDNPFEDGSGIRKGNGWDGLWGLQYTNRSPGRQYVRAAVVEYLQTTNQSGPLHWDRGDYPEPVRTQISDLVTGNDNYYNHAFYRSYTHYGMSPGSPLLTSPLYNKNASNEFTDNRVRAWHLGAEGQVTGRLSWLLKGSYREGRGTYYYPLPCRSHSFDAMAQATYASGPWQLSGAYALTRGNILGDCSTFNLKIKFHGKIM